MFPAHRGYVVYPPGSGFAPGSSLSVKYQENLQREASKSDANATSVWLRSAFCLHDTDPHLISDVVFRPKAAESGELCFTAAFHVFRGEKKQ